MSDNPSSSHQPAHHPPSSSSSPQAIHAATNQPFETNAESPFRHIGSDLLTLNVSGRPFTTSLYAFEQHSAAFRTLRATDDKESIEKFSFLNFDPPTFEHVIRYIQHQVCPDLLKKDGTPDEVQYAMLRRQGTELGMEGLVRAVDAKLEYLREAKGRERSRGLFKVPRAWAASRGMACGRIGCALVRCVRVVWVWRAKRCFMLVF